MSGNGDEPELTKAVSLEVDATGVIPVAGGPETGELSPIDAAKLTNLASGSAYLVVRRGALEGTQFPLLASEQMTIGRSSDSKIFLDDVTVSRKHASVALVGTDWVLSDSGSLNGTYVNKHRVSSTALNNNDELQIGKFRFVFVLAPIAGQ
jgi:pSer/pThr/pTyr-binding forkhead associated (FHA) protein